jgi:hypothetical protein
MKKSQDSGKRYKHIKRPTVELKEKSEIVPGIWQGKRPKRYIGYDLVVSCEEFLAKAPMEGYQGLLVHCPMRDEDDYHIDRKKIEAAAAAVERVRKGGGKVLIHCTGGLNRSSVVTATVLINWLKMKPWDAIGRIRERHDSLCLCNRQFERWVTGETLPTQETSAFNA